MRMKVMSLMIAGALAAFAGGCDDARSCTADSECFDGEVCAAERCVPASELERDGGPSGDDGGQTDPDAGPTEDSGPAGDSGPGEDTGPTEDANTEPHIIEVAAGGTQTCALFSNDDLYCWGDNREGRLNVDLDEDDVLYPDPVVGIDEVTAISAGKEHICAVRADRSLWCWGVNVDHDPSLSWEVLDGPYEMPFSNVDRVVTAYQHTCAIIDDGQTVACWGQSDTTTTPDFDAPVTDLAVGSDHACALIDTGDVHCWGDDYYDQLGYGDPVRDLGEVVGIAAGKIHTCARNTSGEVSCWGWNEQGQLGNIPEGSSQDKTPNPRKVGDIDNAIALTAGTSYSCALLDTGKLLCWGGIKGWPEHHYRDNDLVEPTTLTGLSSGVEQIAGGRRHTCALKSDGSLWCWGENEDGQLGDGREQFDREQPARVQF